MANPTRATRERDGRRNKSTGIDDTRKMRRELSRVIRELSPHKGYYIRLFPLFHVLSFARNLALSEKICELAGSSLLFTVKPNTGQCIRHRIP